MNVSEMTGTVASEARRLRTYLDMLRGRIGATELRSGAWFQRLVESFLEAQERRRTLVALPGDAEARTARTEALIRRASALVALTSAGSGTAWTGATVTAANANGLAGVVTIPVAALVGAGEAMFRTTVQLQLVRDIAELYGRSLGPEHRGELMRLHALSMGMISHGDASDLGRGHLVHLVHLDSEELGKAVGSRIFGQAAVRQIVPFVGIVTAALGSASAVAHLGRFVRAYSTYRNELIELIDDVARRSPDSHAPLMHGLWSIFTASGPLDRPSAAVLGEVLRDAEHDVRASALRGFVPDNIDWMHELNRTADQETRALALEALTVAAAVDAVVDPEEVSILKRAAEVLERPFEPGTVVELARDIGVAR